MQPAAHVTLAQTAHTDQQHCAGRQGNQHADKTEKLAKADKAGGQGRLGLALRSLQPQEKRETGVKHGLLIEDASGAAAMAGIHGGDVLLAVNGSPIDSVEQVRNIVAKADKSVALLIERDGNRIFVPVRIG